MNNDTELGPKIVASILFVSILVLTGFICGYCASRIDFKRHAIDANVAEWQIDPKTGEKTFQFLSP